MDQRYIALLEHFGLLTREEAEHIAKDIVDSVGSSNYLDAFQDVENILREAHFPKRLRLGDFAKKLEQLEASLKALEEKEEPDYAKDVVKLKASFEKLQKEFVDLLSQQKGKSGNKPAATTAPGVKDDAQTEGDKKTVANAETVS